MYVTKKKISGFILSYLFLLTFFSGNINALPLKPAQNKTVQANAKKVRLFIIGNSFSQNAARFLPQLVKEKGNELVMGRAELGGCSLQRHWEIVEAYEANPEDPKGRQYGGKSLKMLLSEGTWDVVTIQQNSMNSSDVSTYQPYARKLYDYIKKLQPQAKIMMHQTWAYRADSKVFGLVGPNINAKTQKEMWESSRAAYHAVAHELGIQLFPVGDAFWRVSSDAKWGYKPDASYNFTNPVAPALPNQTNSLNIGYTWKDGKLGFDSNHANAAGEYLGSLIWYGILFQESPKDLKFVPEKVPADFAAFLRKVAQKDVKKSNKHGAKKV